MSIAEIRRLGASKEIGAALRLTNDLLEAISDCPYLLVRRAQLIQLGDDDGTFTLEDAERSLLAAVEIDPAYLPALEELAHYYDAVHPDRAKAKEFARRYLESSGPILDAMTSIAGHDGTEA